MSTASSERRASTRSTGSTTPRARAQWKTSGRRRLAAVFALVGLCSAGETGLYVYDTATRYDRLERLRAIVDPPSLEVYRLQNRPDSVLVVRGFDRLLVDWDAEVVEWPATAWRRFPGMFFWDPGVVHGPPIDDGWKARTDSPPVFDERSVVVSFMGISGREVTWAVALRPDK